MKSDQLGERLAEAATPSKGVGRTGQLPSQRTPCGVVKRGKRVELQRGDRVLEVAF